MRKPIQLAAVLLGSLIGCDTPYEDLPAVDPNAPRVHITSPERGTFAGTAATVEVKGTATDDTLVTSVEVNGVTAKVNPDGTWSATVPVAAGTNLLHAVAKDAQGNTGKETRAVVSGPTTALNKTIEQAITATISAQTFNAIGRGASEFAGNGDLTSLVTPINPVVDMGTTNGQPDCLYGQAHVTNVDLGPTTDIQLIPTSGGLILDANLDNARVGAHLQWAVSCLDGSRNVTMTAQRIHIGGLLTAGLDFFGNIKFELQNPDIQLIGFGVDMGGVPQTIIDMLDLDTRLGPVLAWATERFVIPMLNDSLEGLNQTKTVDVFGKSIDVTVMPSRLDFGLEGMSVILDTEIRAQGDSGNFVYVPNTLPAMDTSVGFQLAVADDSANQLLTSLWSSKALDIGFDLTTGPYGEIGKLYDAVELTAKVPPWIDASSGKLVLVVGDLMASFKNGGNVVTQVSINAEVELSVVADATGALRLDVGQPKAYVDVLDDQIDGANALSNGQFEAISSFALSRVVAVGSGAVGAIPLPSAGGVSVKNVSVSQQTGYLVVGGEVQ
jgi:hypothetical protein